MNDLTRVAILMIITLVANQLTLFHIGRAAEIGYKKLVITGCAWVAFSDLFLIWSFFWRLL